MHYQYRWFYSIAAGFALLIAGFFYDTLTAAKQLLVLWSDENELQQKLTAMKQLDLNIKAAFFTGNPQPSSYAMRDLNRVSGLMTLAALHGLTVRSMDFSSAQPVLNQGSVIAHWSLQGSFKQIAGFVFALGRELYPVTVLNFSSKLTGPNRLLAEMDILIANSSKKWGISHHENKTIQSDPFCNSPAAAPPAQKDTSLTVSLATMKMVGYLARGDDSRGLILLPGNTTVAVKVGAVLGKERGMVVGIARDHVVLVVAGGRQFILKM